MQPPRPKFKVEGATFTTRPERFQRLLENAARTAIKKAAGSVRVMVLGAVRGKMSERSTKLFASGFSVKDNPDGSIDVRINPVSQYLDEGIQPHDMKDGLLARGAHVSKKGTRWRDVPTSKGVRRVSDNSAPASWRHPGTSGVHVIQQIRRDIEDRARKFMVAAFQRALEKGR